MKRILSVSIRDCEVQTFRAGGNGGQNQNKRDTGVRVIHHPSGARGESREERSQLQNKRAAFLRMVKTPKFQTWLKVQTGQVAHVEDRVADDMQPKNLLVEVRRNGIWTHADHSDF
jgi:protein subunit release factor B